MHRIKSQIRFIANLAACVAAYLVSSPGLGKELANQWPSIGFDGVGTINTPTPMTKSIIQNVFPDAKVVKSDVFTYSKSKQGFLVYASEGEDPIYQFYPTNKKGYIFAIFTRSPLVEGPSGSRVGITKLKELVDLPEWDQCNWGQNALKNTYVCYGNNVRVMFEAPADYGEAFRDAPQDIVDNGVLIEIMYWPGRPAD